MKFNSSFEMETILTAATIKRHANNCKNRKSVFFIPSLDSSICYEGKQNRRVHKKRIRKRSEQSNHIYGGIVNHKTNLHKKQIQRHSIAVCDACACVWGKKSEDEKL